MIKFSSIVKKATLVCIAVAGFAASVSAQVLIVDDERLEREAAAYKDFNLQTAEYRNSIVQLRQFTSRGGVVEQQVADLEKRKSIIGNDKYEEERTNLEAQYNQARRNLAGLEFLYDKLRQEAMVQVERARQPVIREILGERNAQIILAKRLVMGHSAGIDITTEFIEKLDAELPSVTLTLPEAQPAAAEGATEQPQQ